MSRFASNLRRLLSGFTAAGRAAQLQQRREVRAQASAATERRLRDEDPFIQAIAADPDSDVPRLIFADWLEEHGDPRAEFIRVQCELAVLATDDPHHAELTKRERMLLDQHERLWAAAFRRRALTWKFHRGFVEEMRIPTLQFLEEATPLFRRAPIRHVSFFDDGKHLARLAVAPLLANLATVDLSHSQVGDAGAAQLATSPFLGRLSRLCLQSCEITDSGAEALALSPNLELLTELDLSSTLSVEAGLEPGPTANRISTSGAQALAQSPYLQNLRSLNLRGNSIGETGRQALLERFAGRVQLSDPAPADAAADAPT